MVVLAFVDWHALFAIAGVTGLAGARVGARGAVLAGGLGIARCAGFTWQDGVANGPRARVAHRAGAFVFTGASHLADTAGTAKVSG